MQGEGEGEGEEEEERKRGGEWERGEQGGFLIECRDL